MNFAEAASLLKNSFALSSAPASGAEYAVLVVFRPCSGLSWTGERTDDYFFNRLRCSEKFA
jgi:hypothetical protein